MAVVDRPWFKINIGGVGIYSVNQVWSRVAAFWSHRLIVRRPTTTNFIHGASKSPKIQNQSGILALVSSHEQVHDIMVSFDHERLDGILQRKRQVSCPKTK